MPDTKISQFTTSNAMLPGDVFSVVTDLNGTPGNRKVSNKIVFGRVDSNTIVNATFQANTANVRFAVSSTPANSTAEGLHGQIKWDTNYIYVCVANDVWKRATLATF